MAAKTLTPVRIVTTMRTGSCPEGYVTEDRTLRPLTKAERKAGKPDELKALVEEADHGVYILPNYSTMLEVRDTLAVAGGKGRFWE